MNALKELWEYFTEIMRLSYISELLGWDQQVNMPKGSVKGRAEQQALIGKLILSRIKSDKTGELIKIAEKQDNLSETELAMIREAKREYEHATRIPDDLVVDIAKTASVGNTNWQKAREKKRKSVSLLYIERGKTPLLTILCQYIDSVCSILKIYVSIYTGGKSMYRQYQRKYLFQICNNQLLVNTHLLDAPLHSHQYKPLHLLYLLLYLYLVCLSSTVFHTLFLLHVFQVLTQVLCLLI